MTTFRTWQFVLSRLAGRVAIRIAAAVTLERMPPFVSASALIVRGESVLVVMDAATRQPVLPGGHLKWREDPVAAVVREVREETGYTVEPGNILVVGSGPELAGELGIVRIIYLGRVVAGEMRSSAEGEAMWVPLDVLAGSTGRDAGVIALWRDASEP